MTLQFKNIYSIASNLANLVISEKGSGYYISIDGIKKILKEDHLAHLLLSKVKTTSEKIKVLITTFFILNRKSFDENTLEAFSSNLYVAVIDLYESKEMITHECQDCYGSGQNECHECDGHGKVECSGCDGNKHVDCDLCDGEGVETEEDDEGNDIEVNCSNCNGSGQEDCRECGADGEHTCGYCDGYGEYTCQECDGEGNIDSNDEKYNIRRSFNVMLGDYFLKYDGEYFLVEDFNEIEQNEELIPFNFEIYVNYYVDDDDVTDQERRLSVRMADDFVEVVDVIKLESFDRRIDF